ncbi:MAG TPA: hypothetical protein VFX16_32305 [Pseudonocardiaceae bacterium]|nr:hypothetical protein [Pseudonocardiaceae bacterium]
MLRRIGLRRNPFRRPVDRVELAARFVAVVLIVCTVPFALAAGSAVRQHDVGAAGTRQVTVVTLGAVPPQLAYGNGPTTVPIRARWRTQDGTVRTGLVQVLPPEPAGARLQVWVDADGNAAQPPMSATVLAIRQTVVVAACMVGALLVLVCLLWAVRVWLDRFRFARWDREWARVVTDRQDRLFEQ